MATAYAYILNTRASNFRQLYSVCLLAMRRSNTLNIAVKHRLISWGATIRCCQMCCLLVDVTVSNVS